MSEEFVSIKAGTGRRVTVARAYAEGIKGVELLDLPATDRRGRPLSPSRLNGRPNKPRTTVNDAVAERAAATTPTSGGSAASSPEEAKA